MRKSNASIVELFWYLDSRQEALLDNPDSLVPRRWDCDKRNSAMRRGRANGNTHDRALAWERVEPQSREVLGVRLSELSVRPPREAKFQQRRPDLLVNRRSGGDIAMDYRDRERGATGELTVLGRGFDLLSSLCLSLSPLILTASRCSGLGNSGGRAPSVCRGGRLGRTTSINVGTESRERLTYFEPRRPRRRR